MRAIQIVGRKKSGKTGLVVALIPLLQQRGLRVGSVKHSSHPHALDREGTDSWRHREAGAEATLAITAAAVSLHFPVPDQEAQIEALIEQHLGGLDFVLIEGWVGRRGPRIEVLPADKQGRPRAPLYGDSGDLIAVVLSPGLRPSAEAIGELELAVPWFYWKDTTALADFILCC